MRLLPAFQLRDVRFDSRDQVQLQYPFIMLQMGHSSLKSHFLVFGLDGVELVVFHLPLVVFCELLELLHFLPAVFDLAPVVVDLALSMNHLESACTSIKEFAGCGVDDAMPITNRLPLIAAEVLSHKERTHRCHYDDGGKYAFVHARTLDVETQGIVPTGYHLI
jgi:hypothetical protein